MIATIVKIDLVGSKAVSAANQLKNPSIRKQLLDKLLEISNSKFPQADAKYPKGSFYKGEGDAVYFILAKPTVALRSSIEFMQGWFNVQLPDVDRCPDCRIMIDRGDIQTVDTPAGDDFVSAAFENIAVAEKGLQGGSIYASRDVVDNCDRTLARFVSYSTVQPRPAEKVEIYKVDFLDPRTTDDSSLLHALFVAHPQSQEARDRVLELFLLEYLLENKELKDFDAFNKWAKEKSYSTLPKQKLEELCSGSTYVMVKAGQSQVSYTLTPDGLTTLEKARKEFVKARDECIHTVQSSITKQCGTSKATDQYDLPLIVEEYLCAIFSETRMMANYFRDTSQLFDTEPNELEKFDYVLRRHLPFNDARYFGDWRKGFVEGLKSTSGKENGYVAAVFHNVLATYYLNRSTKPSAYQTDKLAGRQLYLDTNILYALKVAASNYHEVVKYFVDRLSGLNIPIYVFPFTLTEYEKSLALTEQEVKKNEVSAFLLRWNPWLYQEFMLHKARYLGKIEVCRQQHSVLKGKGATPVEYDAIDLELKKDGLVLQRDFARLTQEERDALWADMRQLMASSKWSIDDYYDFIYQSTKSSDRIAHDTDCVSNLLEKYNKVGRDELGPKLMFITLDRQLARTRKKYEFIVTSEQFLEFMMPYLFLNDIPVKDADKFPNQLLSAQLGTLLIGRKIEANDLVRGFLTDPKAAEQFEKGQLGSVASEIAMTLSSSRFQGVVEEARQLDEPTMKEAAAQIASKFENMEARQRTLYFENQAGQFAELKRIVSTKDKQIEKLQKTLKYLRSQKNRGKRS